MSQRPGRSRRRGPSLGERFGRFKVETEDRLRKLEFGHEKLAAVTTEILASQAQSLKKLSAIEQKTEIFADAVGVIDRFIKQFSKESRE